MYCTSQDSRTLGLSIVTPLTPGKPGWGGGYQVGKSIFPGFFFGRPKKKTQGKKTQALKKLKQILQKTQEIFQKLSNPPTPF